MSHYNGSWILLLTKKNAIVNIICHQEIKRMLFSFCTINSDSGGLAPTLW